MVHDYETVSLLAEILQELKEIKERIPQKNVAAEIVVSDAIINVGKIVKRGLKEGE